VPHDFGNDRYWHAPAQVVTSEEMAEIVEANLGWKSCTFDQRFKISSSDVANDLPPIALPLIISDLRPTEALA